jgi:LuxR family transcriptional regulator, maltose regulon positive regulatory protein
LMALSLRGEVLQAQGHLHQSAQQYEQVLQLAEEYSIPDAPVTGYALVGLGRTWCEWNDFDAAARFVHDGLEYGKKAGILDILLRGFMVLARIRQAQNDFEGALEALENAESAARQMGMAEIKDWINSYRAQIWLARGQTEAAVGWASTTTGNLFDSIYPSVAIVLSKIRLAQKKPDEALDLLEHALQSAHAVGRHGNAIQILEVKALVQQSQGDRENAFLSLSEALTLAAPEGYIRVFLDEGEPLKLLIADFLSSLEYRTRGKVPDGNSSIFDYAHTILAAFAPSSIITSTPKSTIDSLQASLPEPLSERELEVLRLLAGGLSNRDIADKDVVSINTVKTQVKSIYGKLGTHNREDAIAMARKLRLI